MLELKLIHVSERGTSQQIKNMRDSLVIIIV